MSGSRMIKKSIVLVHCAHFKKKIKGWLVLSYFDIFCIGLLIHRSDLSYFIKKVKA